jgi:leucyl/phenylalanyl-tRNA--protein transferase
MSSPLTPDQLLRAYALGVFPMARQRDDSKLYWIDPDNRGILPLEQFHLPRSLRKTLRKRQFTVCCDTAFEAVMLMCAEATPNRPETWINNEILRLFVALHRTGMAHSVETWQDGLLVGGLYGLSLGGAFFGESMFSRATDASKVALAHLVARLRKGGYSLLDTQFVTDHLSQFGTIAVPRRDYLARLARALDQRAVFYGAVGDDEVLALLSAQSNTQMS